MQVLARMAAAVALIGLAAAAWWGVPAAVGDDAGRGDLPAALPDDPGSVPLLKPGSAFEPVGLVVSYGQQQLVAVGTETGALRRFELPHATGTLSLSADGTALGWVDPDEPEVLHVWDLVGGDEQERRLEAAGGAVTSALLAPDGDRVALTVSAAHRQVLVADLADGTTASVPMQRPLAWTADGEELLPFSEFDIAAVDVATGERRTVVEITGDGEGVASAVSPDEQTVVQWRTGAEGDGPVTGHVIDVHSGDDTALDSDTTGDLTPDVLAWVDDDVIVAVDPGDADEFAEGTPDGTGLVTVDVSDQVAEPLIGWAPSERDRQTLVAPQALADAVETSTTTSWWTDRPWLLGGAALLVVAALAGVVVPWSRIGR